MIYLDNAATSYPKPACVNNKIYDFISNIPGSAGRSAHSGAQIAMEILFEARMAIADLMCVVNPERIVFTYNTTHGLNIAIKGCVKSGDHVVTTSLEHNSVLRPLVQIGAKITTIPQSGDGSSDMTLLKCCITPETKLVVINHASNVSGVINDIYEASKVCKEMNVPLLVDCAQTMGVLPIDCERLYAMVAFPGHKGLLGPAGTGGLYIPEGMVIPPFITGGTGSLSESLIQPTELPDAYESGTLNMPGIAGLLEAVNYISRRGIEEIYNHEHKLTIRFLEGLSVIPHVKVICENNTNRVSTVSFLVDKVDCTEVAQTLSTKYDIGVRSGLHCAPIAHQSYGTFESGTVRVSAGYFNTTSDIDLALNAINHIAK